VRYPVENQYLGKKKIKFKIKILNFAYRYRYSSMKGKLPREQCPESPDVWYQHRYQQQCKVFILKIKDYKLYPFLLAVCRIWIRNYWYLQNPNQIPNSNLRYPYGSAKDPEYGTFFA